MKRALLFFLLFALLEVISAALTLLLCKLSPEGSAQALPEATFQAVTAGRVQLCLNLFFCGAALWLFHKEKSQAPAFFFPKKRRLGKLSSLSAVVSFTVLAIGIDSLASPFLEEGDGQMEWFKNMKDDPLCLLLLCFVGPLTEEIVFRKGILQGFLQNHLKVPLALLLSALLFALVHGNWAQGVVAFPLGVALGAMFVRTRSLQLCLPSHMVNNILAVGMLEFPEIFDQTHAWPLSTHLWVGIPMALAGFFGLIFSLKCPLRAQT